MPQRFSPTVAGGSMWMVLVANIIQAAVWDTTEHHYMNAVRITACSDCDGILADCAAAPSRLCAIEHHSYREHFCVLALRLCRQVAGVLLCLAIMPMARKPAALTKRHELHLIEVDLPWLWIASYTVWNGCFLWVFRMPLRDWKNLRCCFMV